MAAIHLTGIDKIKYNYNTKNANNPTIKLLTLHNLISKWTKARFRRVLSSDQEMTEDNRSDSAVRERTTSICMAIVDILVRPTKHSIHATR